MSDIQIMTATVGGEQVAYTNKTKFLVQVGKGAKGSYKTVNVFYGDLREAIFYYTGINIGLGYKKRLLVPSFTKPVMARQLS